VGDHEGGADPLLAEGTRVGDFRIRGFLGEGAMGQVYLAHDVTLERRVALKFIKRSVMQGGGIERFLEEARATASFNHPHIVTIHAVGEHDGRPYLALEYLDGESLRARLATGPLPPRDALRYCRAIAEAITEAHHRGLVHADLKPENIVIPRDGRVRIVDFGVAKLVGGTAHAASGTPAYMAPERWHGVPPTGAIDVWALGIMLHELIVGRHPIADAVLPKLAFAAGTVDLPDLPETPWAALVRACLELDPDSRPTAEELLHRLDQLLEPSAARAGVEPAARLAPGSGELRLARGSDMLPDADAAITGGERWFLAIVLLGSAVKGEPVPGDDELRRAIEPYGGRLDHSGDAAMIVLDADRQVATDQAARAARCALAIRAITAAPPLAVAMGRADAASRRPPDDVVERATQLLSHAATAAATVIATPIALDEMSAGLLDARFDVVETEAGLSLRGERALMQGARTLLGRPTSCVGRDWELTALAGIFDECIDEPAAHTVIVTATAGMGKSRLGAELVSRIRLRADDIAVWVGRGDSLRAGSTLDLLAQALRGTLGISGGEPLDERRDKIVRRVAQHIPAADQKRVAEFLGELVGTPFPGTDEDGSLLRVTRQDAQLMNEQMRRAWLDFLTAETAVRPVLLLLEDLQWGDIGTVRFIDAALREHGKRPWMVLALARPEVFEIFPRLWADRPHVQEIRLKALGRKAAERLIRQVLGNDVAPTTMEHLVELADGNAFYLEELIRGVAEGKDQALPETVLAMVETRLARLPLDARRVLRAASVFGEMAWEGGIVLLLGGAMKIPTVTGWLARLTEQELLAVRPQSRFAGERELAFRHALLREGAYATLTDDDRRRAHLLAGEWLERHGENDPMVLAEHFARGGDGERAARWYLRAAEQAFHVLDLDAAFARASLGLECTPPPELRIELLGMRCQAAGQGYQVVGAAMADAEELIHIAPPGSAAWALGMYAYHEGLLRAGRVGEVLASIARLSEVEPEPDAVGRIALTYLAGIWVLDVFGQIAEGTALEDRFCAVVIEAGDREPKARFWWGIVVGLRASYAHDDPWRGLQHSEALREIYDAIGGEQLFINLELSRGLNLWFLGALEPAERILARIAASDAALGSASSLRRLGLAWLLADRGALDEARALATQLAEHGRADKSPVDEGRGRWVLAEVLRLTGDLEAADRELALALAMATPLEQPAMLGTLAALRLAQGRADEALAVAEDAIARCAAMGGCGLFRGAVVRLVHAEALDATGARDAARRAIAEARARLLAIADKIGDPAYRRSFLEDVPENARTLALASAWGAESGAPAPPNT
jgi:tRNA A-37 threonylcarbamoyl transferase component Bud32